MGCFVKMRLWELSPGCLVNTTDTVLGKDVRMCEKAHGINHDVHKRAI